MAAGAQQAWGTAGVAAWLEEAAKGAHGPWPQPAFCHFSAISCPRRRRAGQLCKASCHAPLCRLLNTTEHLVLGQLHGSPKPHTDPSWTYRAAGTTDFSLSRRPVLLKLDACPGFPALSVKHPPKPHCWDLALAGGWASGSVMMATAKGICRDGHHLRNIRLRLGWSYWESPRQSSSFRSWVYREAKAGSAFDTLVRTEAVSSWPRRVSGYRRRAFGWALRGAQGKGTKSCGLGAPGETSMDSLPFDLRGFAA